MFFEASFLLIGLVALAVPPLLHLLSRRRYEVVEWGAMQFLQLSPRRRRTFFFEQFLLMLFRLLLLTLLVLAFAGPVGEGEWTRGLGAKPHRDIVLILDGSGSMAYSEEGRTSNQAALDWVHRFIAGLDPDDSLTVIHAKYRPSILAASTGPNRNELLASMDKLTVLPGGVNWSSAVRQGAEILQRGSNPQKEIILLTDGLRIGWADPKSLERWELLAGGEGPSLPPIRVANAVPERAFSAENWGVGPIRGNRAVAVAGREVKFRFDLLRYLSTNLEKTPASTVPPVHLEVDGQPVSQVKTPASMPAGPGLMNLPLEFTHRFTTPGSHRLTITIDPDALPTDNRRSFALDVLPAVPVLIVDGGTEANPISRGSDFLRDALAPAEAANPPFQIRTVPANAFQPGDLTRSLTQDPTDRPRVLILSDVPSLTAEQQRGVEQFLAGGGGVLVTLGPRVNPAFYNQSLYSDGQGWLPGKLLETQGDEKTIAAAPHPNLAGSIHPALALFADLEPGGLEAAYFPRRWKLEPAPTASVIASLTKKEPWLIEKGSDGGRVIIASVPMDASWRTNLTDLGDFVRLAHELVYYLASARSSEVNLAQGQAIVYRPAEGESPGGITVEPPTGDSRHFNPTEWPFSFEDTDEPGLYKLTTDGGRTRWYTVQADADESNLTPASDADREAVAKLFPEGRFRYENDRAALQTELGTAPSRQELWPLFLLLCLILLVGEVAVTRRMALHNPPGI